MFKYEKIVARFARNVEWDFFYDFQTLCIMLFFSYFRTLWLLPLSSPLIARLKAFSATIPTAPNSGFAKVTMEILNCTNAPLVTCSTMKKDDVWKKIKWNVTKRWTWLCYGQNPLMSINSKSHNWHRFSTDMQHCNFKKCNKVNGNWPAYREKKKRVNRFIIILSFRLHDLSRRMPTMDTTSSVASTTMMIIFALDLKFVPIFVQFLDCI